MTSISEREAFLRAIVDDPDDDTPRLIYADWLEERGDPQGEFIRVQVELYHRRRGSGRESTAHTGVPIEVLQTRAAELYLRHRAEWERPLTDLGVLSITWERGFPFHVKLSAGHFVVNGELLTTLAPITSATITNLPEPSSAAFAACPQLKKLTHLELCLGPVISDAVVRHLAASPNIDRLVHLDLAGTFLSDVGVRHLATSPHLANLTHLDLLGNDIGVEGIRHFAASTNLARLTHLSLGGNDIGNEGVRHLAASRHLTQLRYLNLGFNNIGNAGAQALAVSPNLAKLAYLSLSGNYVSDAGLVALAAGRHFRQDMEIHTDQFSGTFANFQRWARPRGWRINPDPGTGRGRG
jgi:uncharacterized protein (TIGR02996 family)